MPRQILIVGALALLAGAAAADPLAGRKSGAEILAEASPSDWRALDPELTLYIELERGRVVVELSPVLAQSHVAQIKALAREGFYDGLSFYRVIDGFVAQGGDVLETREGKGEVPLAAEFDEPAPADLGFAALPDLDGYAPQSGFAMSIPTGFDPATGRAWHIHCPGALAMARDEGRDTASTEFYIALAAQRYLDRNLSVFGRVVSGMEHLQALRRVAPAQSAADDLGEKIVSMEVAADVPEAERTGFEILKSGTPTFDAYLEAQRNRPEAFFYHRANHLDLCQFAVPAREVAAQ